MQTGVMHILGRLRQGFGIQTLHNSIIESESRFAVSRSLSQQQREVPAHCLSTNQRKEICVHGRFLMIAEDDRSDGGDCVCEKACIMYLALSLMRSLFEHRPLSHYSIDCYSLPPPISLRLLLAPPSLVLLNGCKGGLF